MVFAYSKAEKSLQTLGEWATIVTQSQSPSELLARLIANGYIKRPIEVKQLGLAKRKANGARQSEVTSSDSRLIVLPLSLFLFSSENSGKPAVKKKKLMPIAPADLSSDIGASQGTSSDSLMQDKLLANSSSPAQLQSNNSNLETTEDDSDSGSTDARRKKKARTTFTGRQIFELEKKFEEKKYLSSSERTEMAKLLNVTETQVGNAQYTILHLL